MNKCPKCGYERTAVDAGPAGICGGCGLVFAKWVERTLGTARLPREMAPDDEESGGWLHEVVARIGYIEPRPDPMIFWGRAAIYAVFFVWGWYFILLDLRTNDIGHSFMHRIDLVFHEAGHVVFIPFGRFMTILGGSLGQLLMPMIVGAALLIKNQDTFGGSIALWWLGQSLMDLAPYIGDARALQLQLVGGGTGQDRPGVHDWENILLDLNLIEQDMRIAAGANALGIFIVLTALAWGAYVLLHQYRNMKSEST